MIILPLVIWVIFHPHRLTRPVWVNKGDGEGVVLLYSLVVTKAEWPVESGTADGSPEVDKLPATGEEVWDLGGGKVGMDARDGGCGGLVDMGVGYWLALSRTRVDCAGATPTEGCGGF